MSLSITVTLVVDANASGEDLRRRLDGQTRRVVLGTVCPSDHGTVALVLVPPDTRTDLSCVAAAGQVIAQVSGVAHTISCMAKATDAKLN